jgi:hypothetical protein
MDVATAVASVVAGAVIGWAGTALTLVGDVNAMKTSMHNIEQRLDAMGVPRAPAAQRRASDANDQ